MSDPRDPRTKGRIEAAHRAIEAVNRAATNSYCSLPVRNQRELVDDLAAVMRVHGMTTPLADGIALALAYSATAPGLVLIDALHRGASLLVVTDSSIQAVAARDGRDVVEALADIGKQCDRRLLLQILDCVRQELRANGEAYQLAIAIAEDDSLCECPDCLLLRKQLNPTGSN